MGKAKLAEGAQSATMINSYKYKLARRAMIAMFDLSSTNLTTLAKDHWLRNAFNEIQLCLNASMVKRSATRDAFQRKKASRWLPRGARFEIQITKSFATVATREHVFEIARP